MAMAALTKRLTVGLALLGSLCLGIIVALTVINTAGFLLDRIVEPFGGSVPGLSGYEELVQLLIGPAALSFFPYCMIHRGHVSVALLSPFFPASLLGATERLSDLMMGGLALFLAWMLARGTLQSHEDGIISPVLGLPEWPFQLACVAALMAWSLIAFLLSIRPDLASTPDEADIHG